MSGAALYDDPDFLRGYRELRRTGRGINDALEIPAMAAALPSDAGARVVDLGCGEGGLAVRLAESGADVMAVDASEQMLAAAVVHPRVRYQCADLATFDLPPDSADLVVSSMALHYVEDFDDLVGRVARWFGGSGGALVFTVEHPVMTAPVVAADCVVDDYADEGRRERTWFVEGIVKYHRTIGSIVATLRRHGFRLDLLDEPLPTLEQVAIHPHLAVHRRRPPILLVSARR